MYLKENHHPTAFRAPKEIREIEDDFEKAQRPWRKHYEKAEKAKKAFHLASKAERSAEIQVFIIILFISLLSYSNFYFFFTIVHSMVKIILSVVSVCKKYSSKYILFYII